MIIRFLGKNTLISKHIIPHESTFFLKEMSDERHSQISLFPSEEGSFISLVQETPIFLEIQNKLLCGPSTKLDVDFIIRTSYNNVSHTSKTRIPVINVIFHDK